MRRATALANGNAGLWAVLVVVANRWTDVILFNVPGEPIRMVSEGFDVFAPQGLRFSGLLKMSAEDNVGDPRPAAEDFAYQPESFEQGLARVYGAKAGL